MSTSDGSAFAFRLTLAALLCVLPRLAFATPEYPEVLDEVMQTRCPDPLSRCLICHTTALGGSNTATQPFARTLLRYGLSRGRDPARLRAALTELPDETDSDEDGTPDKQELVGCLNPSGEEYGVPPEYGCDGGSMVAEPLSAGSSGAWWVLAFLIAMAVVRSRPGRDHRRR